MFGENGWTSTNHEFVRDAYKPGRCIWCGDYVGSHFYVPTDEELEARYYHAQSNQDREWVRTLL